MWMEVFMMERRDKVNYYLDLADVVSQRGTCLRKRYGAVIVKNDEIYFENTASFLERRYTQY